MLEKLLQYHQNIASPEFIEKLLARINRSFHLRNLIIGISSVLGMIAGLYGIIKFWPSSSSAYFSSLNMQALGQYQQIAVSLGLVGLLAFLAWLFNDEFERP